MVTDTQESASPTPAAGGRGARKGSGRRGPRPVQFYREVVSELRKVIYPSRGELSTYCIVVLVFVSVLTAFVSGLDYGLTKAILKIFG
jgi:preprotein translocase subunit SecE